MCKAQLSVLTSARSAISTAAEPDPWDPYSVIDTSILLPLVRERDVTVAGWKGIDSRNLAKGSIRLAQASDGANRCMEQGFGLTFRPPTRLGGMGVDSYPCRATMRGHYQIKHTWQIA